MKNVELEQDAIAHFYSGEEVFHEGQYSHSAYIIKRGHVEISIIRNSKRIVLTTLSKGDLFGEMGVLLSQARCASATATTYLELYIIKKDELKRRAFAGDKLNQKILYTTLNRLNRENKYQRNAPVTTNPLVSFSEILALREKTTFNESLYSSRSGKKTSNNVLTTQQTDLLLDEMVNLITRITGYSNYIVQKTLEQMKELNLIHINNTAEPKTLSLTKNIVAKAERLTKSVRDIFEGYRNTEDEIIETDALCDLVEADRKTILKKLMQDENDIDNFLLFRKSEILEMIKLHGKDYFKKISHKSIEEICELDDLIYVDSLTIQKVTSSLEPFRLASLLQRVDQEVSERILQGMSKRRKNILNNAMESIPQIDDADFRVLEQQVIGDIKRSVLC